MKLTTLAFIKEMSFLWFLFLNTLCYLTITNAELIDSLPGQPSDVTFKQYSGYIVTDDDHGRALFYYFAEAQSENKLSLPLTLWFGGAHGCSSVGVGVFFEHGPFRPGEDGNLIKNEFSWNLESNMLYVDSPIGIAFSYSNTSSDYEIWNDRMTAHENMKFLLKWYEQFPEYRDLDLYIAGDSYGGHLAPQLAQLLLKYNRKPVHVRPIKLKGIALGNPLLDIRISLANFEHLWYHGIISEELNSLQKTICNATRMNSEMIVGKLSEDCSKIAVLLEEEVGDGIEMEDFLLLSCSSSNSSRQHLGRDPCLYDLVEAYLNKPEVQKALHANTTGLPYTWDPHCKGGLNTRLDNFAINMMPILASLIRRNIPLLIYSGDQDLMIPVTQTRRLASMLARRLKLITLQPNEPWYNGDQMGGLSQAFGKLKKGKKEIYLTFATVRGGAHFVPNSSPSEALTLFKEFLKGSPPPTSP